MEVELIGLFIPDVDFDVIVKHVPRHVCRVKIVAPGVERGRPEVHAERLRLMHVRNGVGTVSVTHFMTVDRPADIIRSPFHGVGVPFVMGVETMGIFVRFDLIALAIAVDHVHR